MYRTEVNERSPMRVFEKSMHGGLGRGNVGVVASRQGVGKTPLLVQIALDNLLRDRRVLHVSHEHAVDHVRAYYSEIFHDLAVSSRLAHSGVVELDLERHRLILSLLSHKAEGASLAKLLEVIDFARDVAHFEPDVIIVDGFELMQGSDEALRTLQKLAAERNVELWVSATTHGACECSAVPQSLPAPLDRVSDLLSVVVFLSSEKELVRLCLLKDHNNQNVGDLHLRLDPHTMRIIDEDVPPASERRRDPTRFQLVSGGSKGAEAAFGTCAERWAMPEVNYSFEGHRLLERGRGVVVLGDEELKRGDFSLVYVSKRLNRVLTQIPLIRSILQTIWHQINDASQVFVVGVIQDDGRVKGGTGWGAELARLWKKPLFVFDQAKRSWFRWSGTAWEFVAQPKITSEKFAGIGTQQLTDEGRVAIEELFRRSFGDPVSG